MTQARYEIVKRVFHGAVDLPLGEREYFVADECGSDTALRAEVEHLLKQHEAAEGFLDQGPRMEPLPDEPPKTDATESLRFASYSVLKTLGRGGMGVVYLAQQDGTRRTVALKVIRAGLATPGALKRFAFEAQVLGRLNHPGIAQIYEAGTADTGQGPQPYFAMELVDGVPITQHARKNELPLPQRLALLAQVCDAVEYAHVKGVIHRDLKPGNILVDKAGQVKVLDFGVARATTPALDSSITNQPSQMTEPGQLVGTLPYMSPEQIAGDPDDLDTRSDVYALGVIGYELLADKPAFAVDRLPPLEAARIVKETDPAPLSSFSKIYRGDIETVIAKAMDKDRARRYQSAAALAADIKRYLNDEPVEARPASAWYQVRKFARRNRGLAGAWLTVTVALIGSTASVLVIASREARSNRAAIAAAQVADQLRIHAQAQTAEADRQRLAAQRQEAASRAVVRFFEKVFATVDPHLNGPETTVADLLRAVGANAEVALQAQPDTAIAVMVAAARLHAAAGSFEEALATLNRAVDRAQLLLGPDEPRTHEARSLLGYVLLKSGKLNQAEKILREELASQSGSPGPETESTLQTASDLALALNANGKFPESLALFRQTAESYSAAWGDRNPATLTARENVAAALLDTGEFAESAEISRDVIRMLEETTGVDDPRIDHPRETLARALSHLGKLDEAESLYRQVYSSSLSRLGPSHSDTIIHEMNLATLLSRKGKSDEAIELARSALDTQRRVSGPDHPDSLMAANCTASILRSADRPDEALQLFSDIIPGMTRQFGREHAHTLLAEFTMAEILTERGRAQEAIGLFDTVVPAAARSSWDPAFDSARYGVGRGKCLIRLDRFEEAEHQLRESLQVLLQRSDPQNPAFKECQEALAQLQQRKAGPEPDLQRPQ